jgi:hypothetical protein
MAVGARRSRRLSPEMLTVIVQRLMMVVVMLADEMPSEKQLTDFVV